VSVITSVPSGDPYFSIWHSGNGWGWYCHRCARYAMELAVRPAGDHICPPTHPYGRNK
jgi:hypothetical protein